MKLSDRYQQLSDDQREALAKKAGITTGYLWQLATGWKRPGRKKRVQPSIALMNRLVEADKKLTLRDLVAEVSAEPETVKAD